MPFGATVLDGGHTFFRLWAPQHEHVALALAPPGGAEQQHAMTRSASGWHQLVRDTPVGSRYTFLLADGRRLADPASRSNPDGVHGTSEVIDPARYRWRHAAWPGRPWHEAVICEVHVGTFTEAGTFAAAAERLPDLAATGFSAVELMPVAAFAGERGWGYDGVLPFAPHAAYGTPDDFRAFVDAAHALGLMVFLDVVYNHFGPEGSVLHTLAPEFFQRDHTTPWGAALNFDAAESALVRDFFRHNAVYWIEEFQLDGLRLDAVHGMVDRSATHVVCEIAQALADGPGRTRQVHLMIENDANQAGLLARDHDGRPRCASAQWNDDFHHAAHVLLTGETQGYYVDFDAGDGPDAARHLARALAEGFVYQGEASTHRGGVPRGEPSGHLPPTAFVAFLQNHDQIGNRALGDRLSAPPHALEAMYVCLLLSPHIPMLFMGEEFAASTPFPYFCDFRAELAAAVSAGRRAEFAQAPGFGDEAACERIPEPGARATFDRARLRWSERGAPPHAQRLAFVHELLVLRRRHLIPRLAGAPVGGADRGSRGDAEDRFVRVSWRLPDGSLWRLFANFGDSPRAELVSRGTTVYERGALRRTDELIAFAPGATLVSIATETPDPAPTQKGL